MMAGIFRGQTFSGAKALIEISNLIFYESMTVVSYLWMIYVYIKLKIIEKTDRIVFLWSIPLLLFSIVAISNPFTHLLFNINENNLFVRNYGTYFHWIVTWLYLIVPTIKVGLILLHEKNKNKRKEIVPFLYFIIAPTIAGLMQMFFYGITTSQVGITISILVIFLIEQTNRILSDSLTTLYNRRGTYEYIRGYIQNHSDSELSVFMIDIDKFKQINDKFGHIIGDNALKDVAEALKDTSENMKNRLLLSRYGGDEFLVVAFNSNQEEIDCIKEHVKQELKKKNDNGVMPYILNISIGVSSGECINYADFENLLALADEKMYQEKKQKLNTCFISK